MHTTYAKLAKRQVGKRLFKHEKAKLKLEQYALVDTHTALRLTLSGRSSGAEYTCYQSGHIPNHSTIADQK